MRVLRWLVATPLRKGALGAFVVIAVPVLALAWYLGSPLLFDKTVNEEFPLTVSAVIPENMSRSEVEAVMEGIAKVESDMTETMPATMVSARRTSTGSFRDADRFHNGSGSATIYAISDDEYLLRVEEFRVTNGPALHVLLSAHPDPRSRSEVKDDGYIDLGKLKGNVGNQNYPVPAGVDVSQYRSVVIYCKPFQVIFSVAPLNPAEST